MKKENWIEDAFSTATTMAKDQEFVAYESAVAANLHKLLENTILLVGEKFAEPMSDMIVKKGLEKEFAEFIEVFAMHAFHLGWYAKGCEDE